MRSLVPPGCEKESSRRAQWGDPVSDPEQLPAESKAEHEEAAAPSDALEENMVWK